MWIDSHAHLCDSPFVGEIDEVILRAGEAGVEAIVNICTDRESLDRSLAVSSDYPLVVMTAATPPHTVGDLGELDFPVMEEAARNGHLIAIGETGLDYYYDRSPRDLQRDFLRRYLALAQELDLPVVIHCRSAFEDFFSILDGEFPDLKGVLHCFTGNMEEAKGVIDRDWYLSLSGIATFKKSRELREVAAYVPLDRLMIETDSPYLAPEGMRGKRNEPANLPVIGTILAECRGIPVKEFAEQTALNVRALFHI